MTAVNRAGATLAIALAIVTAEHPARGQGRGIPSSVAFNTMRDGNPEIYVMNWDGTNPRRITDDPATDGDPAMSPDGRDIIFTSNRAGNNDIFLVDSRGGTPVQPHERSWQRPAGRAGRRMAGTSCFTATATGGTSRST